MTEKIIELEGKKYLVTKHENTRVFPYYGRKDDVNRIKYDFEYMDKETSEIDAIKKCILLGCYGMSRNSLHEFRGKYYIKSPNKTPELLKKNIYHYRNVVTFIIQEI